MPFIFSKERGLQVINLKDLKHHLTFISSDSTQGRKFGTETDELGITVKNLITDAEKIGLKPSADNYFQPVEIVSTKPGKNSFIIV